MSVVAALVAGLSQLGDASAARMSTLSSDHSTLWQSPSFAGLRGHHDRWLHVGQGPATSAETLASLGHQLPMSGLGWLAIQLGLRACDGRG